MHQHILLFILYNSGFFCLIIETFLLTITRSSVSYCSHFYGNVFSAR